MGRTALLVIDAQRAFYDGDAIPAVYDGEKILARIGGVLERARVAGLSIVYVQHAGGSGHPLEEGGKGWQIHHEVQPRKGDVVVAKTTPDSFYGTSLKNELDGLGAKDLVVLGNQTDFCIDTTCRRARSLDYRTTLLRDAHSTWDNEYLKAQQIIDHHNFVLGWQFVSLGESISFDFDRLS
ncbi:cysteine hydrolase family protein [Pelagibius sp. Alg239-R121]|uniref:cysteine hydrolase family protein n=1 Tax=Pelagibius sp. Alg239-R121 TaxID=2993448 RepID=UPI0024A677AD|nr:cysteine hydrolase family protein [Pelagibius sp. Alg239-R121]